MQVEIDGTDARGVFERAYNADGFIGEYYNKAEFDIRVSGWKQTQELARAGEGAADAGVAALPPRKRVNAKLSRVIELRSRSARAGEQPVVQVEHQQLEFLMQGRAMRVEMSVQLPRYVLTPASL